MWTGLGSSTLVSFCLTSGDGQSSVGLGDLWVISLVSMDEGSLHGYLRTGGRVCSNPLVSTSLPIETAVVVGVVGVEDAPLELAGASLGDGLITKSTK